MGNRKHKPKTEAVIMVAADGVAIVGPTKERMARAIAADGLETPDPRKGRAAFRATDCDILNHLYGRGVINQDQLQCGEWYYRVWYQSGLAASGVVDPSKDVVDGGNPGPALDARLTALQTWASAAKAIGPVLSHPINEMVLLETPATVYAMRYLNRTDPRDCRIAAYTTLSAALDGLVLHRLGERRTRIRYHHGENARAENRPEMREV